LSPHRRDIHDRLLGCCEERKTGDGIHIELDGFRIRRGEAREAYDVGSGRIWRVQCRFNAKIRRSNQRNSIPHAEYYWTKIICTFGTHKLSLLAFVRITILHLRTTTSCSSLNHEENTTENTETLRIVLSQKHLFSEHQNRPIVTYSLNHLRVLTCRGSEHSGTSAG
jgi:hypothetical protein